MLERPTATFSDRLRLLGPAPKLGLDCSADSRFWISTVDVRDAFHRMALPEDLSHCFALPSGAAREFGVYELDGKPLGVDVCGRAAGVYPLVFSYLSLEHEAWASVNIDILGLIGKDREEVDRVMGRISHELCSRGLLTPELCLASRCCDILGVELDGERLRTRAASTKYEKLRLALHWVLEQRRVSGQKLERVMGHVTYTSLVRRPLSSAFAAVYKFQQAH